MISRQFAPFLTLAVFLLLPFITVEACGPDFEPDVFVRMTHPDDQQKFGRGELGILQPTFDSNELAVAYRYLNGDKLSDQEQAAYAHRKEQSGAEYEAEEAAKPVNQWRAVRAKYAAADGEIVQQHQAPQNLGNNEVYYFPDYLNCPDAAFKTAVLTVNDRANTWGAQSPYLKDWIGAQDAVFSNCSGKSPATPPAAPMGSPALLLADRDYQIAAANFYAGKYENARRQFEILAQDKSSPWQPWGEYLAARAEVRLAFSLGKKTDPWSGNLASFDMKTMQSAQQMLEGLLQHHDSALPRQSIVNELNFVRIRTEPDKRLAEISAALAGPAPDPNFQQDLDDLNYVFYKKVPVATPPPLYAWIVAFRSASAGNSAFATWQQSHALPWLVVAIALANPKDAGTPDLLIAATRIEASSSAFETVAFHRIRLLIGLDRADEARSLLDVILRGLRKQAPGSALNAFFGQRMQVARDFNEFLTYAPRNLLESNSNGAMARQDSFVTQERAVCKTCEVKLPGPPPPLQFADDSIAILNRQVPLRRLVEAASSPSLPPNLRQDVALAAWVRSIVLEDNTSAAALSPLLPESIRETADASTGFLAVLAILQNPGLRPFLEPGVSRLASYSYLENFRNNWWCHDWQTQYYTSEQERQRLSEPQPVSFLSIEEQKTAEEEYERLQKLPCGPVYLGQHAIDYAKVHPLDPDVPEALALTVRATHYGINAWREEKKNAAQNSVVGKAAFQLLHQRYPKSPWTAKTPYYY
ncbi:hypothetical protein [Alloacidobacterium sp.]|uniref:hypothetical protein n=1 Tax=Alloacidobacterium sp. TaxID=2951999 RepID=UPI002D269AE7|nr:hypothetical protein [Alloacidobacterium sp.]HYK35148.1 hypothetical protein [Alloacidobacterium sp.]